MKIPAKAINKKLAQIIEIAQAIGATIQVVRGTVRIILKMREDYVLSKEKLKKLKEGPPNA